ncbi:hypothetical protein [Gemmiger sp.]
MDKKEQILNGLFPIDGENYTFLLQDFYFHIMSSSKKYISETIKADENGLLHATTYDGHPIAVYSTRKELPIYEHLKLKTDNYMVHEFNQFPPEYKETYLFDGIEFVGGSLSKVFFPSSLNIVSENGKSLLDKKDDTISFSFKSKEISYTVSVFSSPDTTVSISGTTVSNANTHLLLKFDTPQTIEKIFSCYNNIRTILSFMTFRTTISFEAVGLLQHLKDSDPACMVTWRLYIDIPPDESKKDNYSCITFEDLGESATNLFQMVFNATDSKVNYSLGFIPSDDKHSGRFNNDRIKAICSAMECESTFCHIPKSEETLEIEKLAEEVKTIIKDHRDRENTLSPKSYDKIFGNISHWGLASSDQIIYLYNIHWETLINVLVPFSITEKDISNFVKFRNDITHGRTRIINQNIVQTGVILEHLVYCCVLSRIGLTEEHIRKLFSHNILR